MYMTDTYTYMYIYVYVHIVHVHYGIQQDWTVDNGVGVVVAKATVTVNTGKTKQTDLRENANNYDRKYACKDGKQPITSAKALIMREDERCTATICGKNTSIMLDLLLNSEFHKHFLVTTYDWSSS